MKKSILNTMNICRFISGLSVAALASITIGCNQTSESARVLQAQSAQPELAYTASDLAPYHQRSIKDEVFYFVLPDRFNNGDKSNDLGSVEKPISYGGYDPTNEMAFHGGDLAGLTEKLPYLEELGITAIWLTPILRNQAVQGDITGYHGYWVLDFTEIDPHLGSNADLKHLIEQAHKRNIKIFFDIITNHTADVVKYKECHGEDGSGWSESGEACPYISLKEMSEGKKYTTVIQAGNETLKTPAWLNDAKHYHNQGDSTFEGENSLNGDFFGLDDLNTESAEVVQGMIDIYKNIISEFKPDGFRIDTVKHVNIEFWQQFTPALSQHAKEVGIENFFMFGEVYAFTPKELSKFTTTGKLPSVLDFGLQSAFYQTLIEQKGSDKLAELFAQDDLYQDAEVLLNFTGNHDMGRFAHLLRASKQYNEEQITQRLSLATAITFFARGIPVIYYGDEQGFIGNGGNHPSRQDMMPSKVDSYNQDITLASNKTTADDNFDRSHPLYKRFTDYAKLYQQHDALRHGKQTTLYSDEKPGLFIIERAYQGQNYLVAFNTSETEQKVSLKLASQYQLIDASEQASINSGKQETELKLSGLSFAIYKAM